MLAEMIMRKIMTGEICRRCHSSDQEPGGKKEEKKMPTNGTRILGLPRNRTMTPVLLTIEERALIQVALKDLLMCPAMARALDIIIRLQEKF